MTDTVHRKLNLAALALMLTAVISPSKGLASELSAPPLPSPVKVEKVRVLNQRPSMKILGTVYSQNQLELTAGVNGRLEWVAEPGTYLKKDELVAQVELLPLQLRQAERKAQHKRARINLDYLNKELRRQSELRIKNNTSQLQFERTQSQVELAHSDLEIAELQLKQINQELNRATITAPFEGVITQRLKRKGYDVTRSDVLVQMVDTKRLEIRVFVPIKYLTYTKSGTPVTLSSRQDDTNIYSLQSSATTIIPAADPLSQTFEMRIAVPNQGNEVWSSGQLIEVEIPIQSKQMTIAVHRDALILRNDGTYVVKINNDNIAQRLKVSVGKGKDDWVMVSGDIDIGDQVAIRGAERLAEGQKVVIQTAGK
ncbi:MAG: efflux RND transporter periplasmic adaptor subunit [Kangiellaceae bacterium]|nr:efflux RND transporter periplasmic adaptor subunit [Kangiellaceae bacterium]